MPASMKDARKMKPATAQKKRVRNTNSNEHSRGRLLLHGQDMDKTQNHRNGAEQWLVVDSGWRLVVVGSWRLAGSGGWWSLGAVLYALSLTKKNWVFLGQPRLNHPEITHKARLWVSTWGLALSTAAAAGGQTGASPNPLNKPKAHGGFRIM